MVDALHPRVDQQPEVQSPAENGRFFSPLTDKGNGEVGPKHRIREITSRYMASPSTPSPKTPSSSTRRFPSPAIGRSSGRPEPPHRPISTERKRPDSPAPTRSSIDAAKTGTWSATPRAAQRLSTGDGERSSQRLRSSPDSSGKDRTGKGQVLDHTLKPVANGLQRGQDCGPQKAAAERKGTPERKPTPLRRSTTDQAENAKPIDKQQAWPGRNSPKRGSPDTGKDNTGAGQLKGHGRVVTPGSRPFKQSPPIRSLGKSATEVTSVSPQQSVSRDMLSESRSGGALEKFVKRDDDEESVTSEAQNPVDNFSDCESLSSICSSATMIASINNKSTPRPRRLSDGDMMRASLREQELAALSTGGKTMRRLRSLSMSGPPPPGAWSLSPGRSSPSQPSSPRRSLPLSPHRSTQSPTRTSISPLQLPPTGHSAIFSLDTRLKGKKAISQQEEAFLLRILHNRWLQWRFVNARADAVRSFQTAEAERSICNAWMRTSDLRRSVVVKRIELQQAREAKKLQTVLLNQGPPLESWCSIKHEHSVAVSGALDALQAAVLRVPATAGVRADLRTIKETLSFAVDVMNSVDSLVTSLMAQTETTEELLADLATVSGQEKALLGECNALLDAVAGLETEERSLKAHLLQREGEKFSNVSVDPSKAKFTILLLGTGTVLRANHDVSQPSEFSTMS